MARKSSLALIVMLFSTAAVAQSVSEKTGVNSVLGVAPKTPDFVTEAAESDMTEIAAAKIALQKGDADEKQFADQMVHDHSQTSEELKGLVSSGGVEAALPTALDDASKKKIDKLNNVKPADFKRKYDSMQVDAHKSAVSLFQRYAKGGDNAKLKDWAQKTLPTLQHHLEMAEMLYKRK
jgi:putative membrane protein